MSVTYTYATLTQALQDWPEDNDPNYVNNIPIIIGMAELRLLRDLDLELFDVQTTVQTTGGSNLLPKPTGYITNRTLDYVDGNNTLIYLQPRSVEYMKDFANSAGVGNPIYFGELNETNWMVAPTPANQITINVRYTTRPVGLGPTVTTTWLSTNAADALFYCCLICAEEFLKGDERLPVWIQRYQQDILPRVKREVYKIQKLDYNLDPPPPQAHVR
jgi:hypothetical protein